MSCSLKNDRFFFGTGIRGENMSDSVSSTQSKIKNDARLHSWIYGVSISMFISVIVSIFIPVDNVIRFLSGLLIFIVVVFPAVKLFFYFLSRDLVCKSCNASYSIDLIDTQRDFVSAIPRSKIQNKGIVGGDTRSPNCGKKIITKSHWTEERYNITNVYSCVSCGETYSTKHIETRKTDYSSSTVYQ